MRGATSVAASKPQFREIFQPTRPLRGATWKKSYIPTSCAYFNPRAPCGARLRRISPSTTRRKFQPTRPLRGATHQSGPYLRWSLFQPTRPLRGATRGRKSHHGQGGISTHAPLAGRDPGSSSRRNKYFDFNPRAPCGARLKREKLPEGMTVFQPTRPLRGATIAMEHRPEGGQISTHAPLAGRDSKSVQITMHIFAITDKFQMLLHRMPPVRAFCSFLMQENHADFGCEPPK